MFLCKFVKPFGAQNISFFCESAERALAKWAWQEEEEYDPINCRLQRKKGRKDETIWMGAQKSRFDTAQYEPTADAQKLGLHNWNISSHARKLF